jgi:hypothetical protein
MLTLVVTMLFALIALPTDASAVRMRSISKVRPLHPQSVNEGSSGCTVSTNWSSVISGNWCAESLQVQQTVDGGCLLIGIDYWSNTLLGLDASTGAVAFNSSLDALSLVIGITPSAVYVAFESGGNTNGPPCLTASKLQFSTGTFEWSHTVCSILVGTDSNPDMDISPAAIVFPKLGVDGEELILVTLCAQDTNLHQTDFPVTVYGSAGQTLSEGVMPILPYSGMSMNGWPGFVPRILGSGSEGRFVLSYLSEDDINYSDSQTFQLSPDGRLAQLIDFSPATIGWPQTYSPAPGSALEFTLNNIDTIQESLIAFDAASNETQWTKYFATDSILNGSTLIAVSNTVPCTYPPLMSMVVTSDGSGLIVSVTCSTADTATETTRVQLVRYDTASGKQELYTPVFIMNGGTIFPFSDSLQPPQALTVLTDTSIGMALGSEWMTFDSQTLQVHTQGNWIEQNRTVSELLLNVKGSYIQFQNIETMGLTNISLITAN